LSFADIIYSEVKNTKASLGSLRDPVDSQSSVPVDKKILTETPSEQTNYL
jgi:hypothetical protein